METKMMALITVITGAVKYGIPLLYGTTGEIITEKSGSLNLGVEGVMAVGAIGGYLIGIATNSLIIAVLGAFFFAGICGLIFSFLTVTLQANQNVTGLAMTIFGVGIYQFIGQSLKTANKFPAMTEHFKKVVYDSTDGLASIPYIGKLFFSYNSLVYLAIIIAICTHIYIKYSKKGLQLRAMGENPGSADSVGVKINKFKYFNIILGCGISGIGGLYMGLTINNGAYNDNWIAGYGWISIALVIFSGWSSAKAIGGSLLFGLFLTLQSSVSLLINAFPKGLGWMSVFPTEFYQMLPFLMTALVLIIGSIVNKKSGNAPKSLGVNYYREDR